MLEERVLAFAREIGALRRGDTYVVGVSGGVDSVALLHALRAVSGKLGIKLHVAHLNHGLRGEAADLDAEFVGRLAREWGLSATVKRADVAAYAAEHDLSLEAAARQVRYGFFADVVDSLDARAVVVAHTADDQVETVLLHLLRGTGLAGLRGMLPMQHLRVGSADSSRTVNACRPLLQTSRAEVEAYAEQHRLPFREDATNADPAFTRNRIRHELLPLLESFNPGVRQGIMRMAGLLGDDLQFLAEVTEPVFNQTVSFRDDGVAVKLTGLRDTPLPIARLLLRGAYGLAAGGLVDLTAEHTEQVLALATSGRTGAKLALPGRVVVRRTYGELRFSQGEPEVTALPEAGVQVRVPGRTEMAGWVVDAEVRSGRCGLPADDKLHVDLDADKAGTDITLRRRARGDKMRPLGLGGSKKLQDIMVDGKVPSTERDTVPVLVSPSRILWVAGLAVDQGAATDPNTRRYLCLQLHKKGAM